MGLGEDIRTRLVAQGLTDIFVGQFPATPPGPETCIAVLPYPGLPPARVFGASLPAYEDSRVQIQARSSDYASAQRLASDAMNALDWMLDTTLNGVRYHAIEALQRPAFKLGLDENARTIFAANFAVRRAASTS